MKLLMNFYKTLHMAKEKDANLLKSFVGEIMKNFVKVQSKRVAQKIIHIRYFVKNMSLHQVVLLKNHMKVTIAITMKSLNLHRHLYMKYKDDIHDVSKQKILNMVQVQDVLDLVVKMIE